MQSKGEIPNQKTEVYVVDSIGEIGLWYKASKVVFIGGTFSSVEGHNPWEAVHLDCTVIFGPRYSNFNDDFKLLERLNLAFQIIMRTNLVDSKMSNFVPHQAEPFLGSRLQGPLLPLQALGNGIFVALKCPQNARAGPSQLQREARKF